jgi:hypothetical protein
VGRLTPRPSACAASTYISQGFIFFVAISGVYGIIATMKKKINKPRFLIPWNIGERVEKPVKGKGSFSRKEKHKKRFDRED